MQKDYSIVATGVSTRGLDIFDIRFWCLVIFMSLIMLIFDSTKTFLNVWETLKIGCYVYLGDLY